MSVHNLIDAIASGDSQATQQAFEAEMMSRVAARMDEKRQEVARNMFKESVGSIEEAADGKPAKVGDNHIHVQRVNKNGKPMYHVHAVGKNFADGIKVGYHMNDTELDDVSEMGAHIKMKKTS